MKEIINQEYKLKPKQLLFAIFDENEIIGYRNTFDFSQKPNDNAPYIPEQTKQFLNIYFKYFE